MLSTAAFRAQTGNMSPVGCAVGPVELAQKWGSKARLQLSEQARNGAVGSMGSVCSLSMSSSTSSHSCHGFGTHLWVEPWLLITNGVFSLSTDHSCKNAALHQCARNVSPTR